MSKKHNFDVFFLYRCIASHAEFGHPNNNIHIFVFIAMGLQGIGHLVHPNVIFGHLILKSCPPPPPDLFFSENVSTMKATCP